MDGISAVTARISEIRALLHPIPPPTAAAATTPTPPTTSGATATPAASFADALARAATPGTAAGVAPGMAAGMTPGVAFGATPAGAGPAVSVAELQATYANGRVPADALAPIGAGGHRLAAPAAAAFQDLQTAARRDGVSFGVTDSYRSFDQQIDVARRKGLYSQGGLAAQPGTSQHGWGLAVDLDLDPRAQTWMRANAGRFGFVEDTPREPWHWAFKP